MKLRLPKKRRYRIYIYILCSLLLLLALDLLWVRIWRTIHIGYDTTRITGPLRPDGTIDYVRAIDERLSAGVTPENNAMPLLLEALGPKAVFNRIADYVYTHLEMKPLPETGDYYKDFGEFLGVGEFFGSRYVPGGEKTKEAEAEFDLSRSAPWTAQSHPRIADWLGAQSRPLQLFHDASLRTRYYFPSDPPGSESVIAILLPSLGSMRGLANMAASRAMLRAGAGDFPGAQADLLTIHRNARLVSQGWTIIERLVGVAMENMAARTEQALAVSETLSAPQARQLLAELQALPPLPPIAESIDSERFGALDTLVYASHHGMPVTLNMMSDPETNLGWYWLPPTLTALVPAHLDAAMRQVNAYYDAYLTAAKAPSYAQRCALFPNEANYIGPATHDPSLGAFLHPTDRLLHMLLPNFTRASALYDACRMESDLTRLALALAAYHADHNAYPDTLAALAPAYLPAIPPDLFIDAPLHYTRTPTGYLLYSVGMNAQDDAGHNYENPNPQYPSADDLVVRAGPPSTATTPAK